MLVLLFILKILGIIMLALLFFVVYCFVIPLTGYIRIRKYDELDVYGYMSSNVAFFKLGFTYEDGQVKPYSTSFWGHHDMKMFTRPEKKKPSKAKKNHAHIKIPKKHVIDDVIFFARVVIEFVRKIHFDFSKADFEFSMGEPDKTGIMTGYISLLPVVHSGDCNIVPDFDSDEAYFNGEIEVSVKVYLFTLIQIFIKMKREM